MAHSSNCTQDIVARYFVSDELPPQEVTCEPDQSVFELIDEKRRQRVGLTGKRSIPILLWVVLAFLVFVCVCLVFLLCSSK
jgi:cytochrome oxidase assembly protein ShyY1